MPIDFTGYMYAHTMIKSHRNYSIFLRKYQEFYFKKLEFFSKIVLTNSGLFSIIARQSARAEQIRESGGTGRRARLRGV